MQFRPHRYPTSFPLALRTPKGVQKGTVIDVNNVGARMTGVIDVRRGDKIVINLMSQTLPAIVMWTKGDRIGIVFRPQITDTQLDMLRFRPDGRHGQHRGAVGGFGYAEMR